MQSINSPCSNVPILRTGLEGNNITVVLYDSKLLELEFFEDKRLHSQLL